VLLGDTVDHTLGPGPYVLVFLDILVTYERWCDARRCWTLSQPETQFEQKWSKDTRLAITF